MSEHLASGQSPEISTEEALSFVEQMIHQWDFEQNSERANAQFVTHLAHWTLEVFGQMDTKGIYHLYSKSRYDDGFPHDELPGSIQPYVMTEHYGDFYPGNNNSISMVSAPQILEEDPYIHNWDEIKDLSFAEMLAAAQNSPEIMALSQPGKFQVLPGVKLYFKPESYFEWGLEFVFNFNDIDAYPFGRQGKTTAPFRYAVEAQGKKVDLAKTASQLILLAAKYTDHWRGVKSEMLDIFHARVAGNATVPLDRLICESSPRNAIKNLLIGRMFADKHTEL